MHRLTSFIAVCLLLVSAVAARASNGNNHVDLGGVVNVEENEAAGDIVCAFCDVTIHGRVTGDVVIAFGNLHVDAGKEISGDVVAFATPMELQNATSIGGDLVTLGGSYSETNATVHGDRVISPSPLWILVPLAPFLLLGGLIWLVISAIRNRTPYPPPYPGRYQRM